METSSYILVGCVAMAGYSLPSIVAFIRQHPATPRITALNLCLGWTVIGWIAAFFWATTSRHHHRYRLMTVSARADQPESSAIRAVTRPCASVPRQPGLTAHAGPRIPLCDGASHPVGPTTR